MDLQAITTFLAVVEAGSVQGAAAQLAVARATVRRRLEDLETSLGVTLIHRSRLGATPTPAGVVLARRGQAVMEQANVLLGSLRELNAAPSGELRVVAPIGMPTAATAVLGQTVMRLWAGVTFDVQFSPSPIERLRDDADIALTFGDSVPEHGYEVLELATIRERLVASPAYLDAHGRIESVDGLGRYDLLVWTGPGSNPRLLPTLDGLLVPVTPRFVSGDVHLLHTMAANGAGVAYVPDGKLLPSQGGPGVLEPVLDHCIGRSRTFSLVVPEALADVPRVRTVVELVRGFIKGSS